MELNNIIKEIDDFVALCDNWDGYGGIPLFRDIAEKTKLFIAMLDDYYIDNITDIYPNPHGTLNIEWENENKKDEKLCLEIGSCSYSYFVKYNNRDPKLSNGLDIIENIKEIENDLDILYGVNIIKDFINNKYSGHGSGYSKIFYAKNFVTNYLMIKINKNNNENIRFFYCYETDILIDVHRVEILEYSEYSRKRKIEKLLS